VRAKWRPQPQPTKTRLSKRAKRCVANPFSKIQAQRVNNITGIRRLPLRLDLRQCRTPNSPSSRPKLSQLQFYRTRGAVNQEKALRFFTVPIRSARIGSRVSHTFSTSAGQCYRWISSAAYAGYFPAGAESLNNCYSRSADCQSAVSEKRLPYADASSLECKCSVNKCTPLSRGETVRIHDAVDLELQERIFYLGRQH
jgi:hypothetical protein